MGFWSRFRIRKRESDYQREDNLKILFIHTRMPTFARTDFDILTEVHDVRELNFPSPQQGWHQVIGYLPALWHGVQWADLTFSWFGKLHAFFAVLFSKNLGKKAVVVVSGGEVCRFSFGDGRYRSVCTHPIKKFFPRFVVRHADMILPVSNYVYREAVESVKADTKKMRMIYHGFDTTHYRPISLINKQRIAITVSEVMAENLYHKRLSSFILAAGITSDISFRLIGPDLDGMAEKLSADLPKNASITRGVYGDSLVKEMSRAAVYVQASVWESFGCAVAEAMACECVPVVTRIPALEEVVGDCGVYLNDPVTPEEIAAKVQVALQHPELGRQARQRVIEKFPIEERKSGLLNAVNSIFIK